MAQNFYTYHLRLINSDKHSFNAEGLTISTSLQVLQQQISQLFPDIQNTELYIFNDNESLISEIIKEINNSTINLNYRGSSATSHIKKNILKYIVSSISILTHRNKVKFKHVHREKNFLADMLSKSNILEKFQDTEKIFLNSISDNNLTIYSPIFLEIQQLDQHDTTLIHKEGSLQICHYILRIIQSRKILASTKLLLIKQQNDFFNTPLNNFRSQWDNIINKVINLIIGHIIQLKQSKYNSFIGEFNRILKKEISHQISLIQNIQQNIQLMNEIKVYSKEEIPLTLYNNYQLNIKIYHNDKIILQLYENKNFRDKLQSVPRNLAHIFLKHFNAIQVNFYCAKIRFVVDLLIPVETAIELNVGVFFLFLTLAITFFTIVGFCLGFFLFLQGFLSKLWPFDSFEIQRQAERIGIFPLLFIDPGVR
ncbi:hypothetical protein ABPG72_020079 [Tetrahymena utriculariae]